MALVLTMVALLIAAELWRRGACATEEEVMERAKGDNSWGLFAVLLVIAGLAIAVEWG